jgi:hypothetical protein
MRLIIHDTDWDIHCISQIDAVNQPRCISVYVNHVEVDWKDIVCNARSASAKVLQQSMLVIMRVVVNYKME